MSNVVTISGVKKLYKMGSETVAALNGVDLKIDSGEFVALMAVFRVRCLLIKRPLALRKLKSRCSLFKVS